MFGVFLYSAAPRAIGVTTIGGATDGHSALKVPDSNIGRDFDHRDPQFPKTLAFGGLGQALLRLIFQLAPAEVLPIHTLKVASHLFATFPGEPTITTAFRLEKALKAATGVASASIIGYAGDYSGYYPTHEEYMLQRYEGASMIRGRHASQEISEALVKFSFAAPTLHTSSHCKILTPPPTQPKKYSLPQMTFCISSVALTTRSHPYVQLRNCHYGRKGTAVSAAFTSA